MPSGDARVQEALRAWRETGAAEAEADYLAARLRVGELEPEQLSLAVYLGHPAALLWASGEQAAGSVAAATAPLPIYGWVHGLGGWGFPATVRVALLGAGLARDRYPSSAETLPQLDPLIRATQRWLLDREPLPEELTWSFVTSDWADFPWGQWLARELDNVRSGRQESVAGRNAASLIASLVHRGALTDDELRRRVRLGLVAWALGVEHTGG